MAGGGGSGRSGSARRTGPLTANAGLAAVTELCGRLGVIEALDAAVGPIKQRERGFGAGELLCGIAAAQLAGEDFLAGLDRQRADAAGQQLTPVPGLASTTAAGLARRITPAQWQAVERGLATVTGRMLSLLPAERAVALAGGPVTIDLDTTDVEVYGRRSAAWRITTRASGSAGRTWRPGPRPRSCWPLTWATAPMTRARPRRICCAVRWHACPRRPGPGGWRCAPTRATSPGSWPALPTTRSIAFAIGARRIAPLWRLLDGIADDDWHDAIEMDGAQVAVAQYCPDWWPADTRLLVRRVLLDPARVSADPRSRRRRTLHPDQRDMLFPELAQQPADLRLQLHPDEPGRGRPVQGGRCGALVPSPHHGGEHLPRQQARRRPAAPPIRISPGQPGRGCGARCSRRPWPPGCTSSPPCPLGEDIVHGHGVRGGKAMIATLRWRLIAVPGQLIRHARHLILRLPPGHGLLPEILARLRDLPVPA